MLTIHLRVRRNPALAPSGPRTSLAAKVRSFTGVIETLIIFATVMGGIFWGIFTPTEAAALGAFFTLLLALVRRQLTWKAFKMAISDTTRISCMVMVIVAGATIFGRFIAVTRIPFDLSAWISQLPLPGFAIMLLIILIYLFGGCFMDSLAMIMLTIPIFFPVAEAMGYDPIWFGVMTVLVAEMGVVTPPVGINVYVVHGVSPDVPLETIFRGVLPMVIALVICAVLILAFPQIALWLPGLMR
jgi:tripartite ATP-independent transporter DctM subunit